MSTCTCEKHDADSSVTIGERIAAEFSADRERGCYLADAEQRRLAEMVDGKMSPLLAACKDALQFAAYVYEEERDRAAEQGYDLTAPPMEPQIAGVLRDALAKAEART